jgi:Putative heavy-metal-binding
MASRGIPAPDLYTAAGNVNQPYESLGVVLAVVSRQQSGCGGGLPVGQALKDATDELKRQAATRGANGLIHISFMHRVTTSPGCGGASTNIEVYAWGTAVKL